MILFLPRPLPDCAGRGLFHGAPGRKPSRTTKERQRPACGKQAGRFVIHFWHTDGQLSTAFCGSTILPAIFAA